MGAVVPGDHLQARDTAVTPDARASLARDRGGADRGGARRRRASRLSRADVREVVSRRLDPVAIRGDGWEVEIRALAPEDAAALTRCFQRCYGDTYPAAEFYDPEAI